MALMTFPFFREWQAAQRRSLDEGAIAIEASLRLCDQLDDILKPWELYPDLGVAGYEGELYRSQIFHQFYTATVGMWSCSYSPFVQGWRGHDDVLAICRKLRVPELEDKLLEGREMMRQFSERDLDLFDAIRQRGPLRGTGEKMNDPDKENALEEVLMMHYARWRDRRDHNIPLRCLGPFDDPAEARHAYTGDPVLVALAQYVDAISNEHPMVMRALGPADTAAVPSRIEDSRSHMVGAAETMLMWSPKLLQLCSENGLWLEERKGSRWIYTGCEYLEDDTPRESRKLRAALFWTKANRDIVAVEFSDAQMLVDAETWSEIGRVMEPPSQYQGHRARYASIRHEPQFSADLEGLKIAFDSSSTPNPRRLAYCSP